jgi:hypothetical protein
MRVLALTTTALDMTAQVAPFTQGYTAVALAAAGVTLEHSDTVDSGYADLIALTAGIPAEVTISKQYLRVKSSGVAKLIGN